MKRHTPPLRTLYYLLFCFPLLTISGCFDTGMLWDFKAKYIHSSVPLKDGQYLVGWGGSRGPEKLSLVDSDGKELWRKSVRGSLWTNHKLNWFKDSEGERHAVVITRNPDNWQQSVMEQFDWQGNKSYELVFDGSINGLVTAQNSIIIQLWNINDDNTHSVSRIGNGSILWTREFTSDEAPTILSANSVNEWWLSMRDIETGVTRLQKYDLDGSLVTDLVLESDIWIRHIEERVNGIWAWVQGSSYRRSFRKYDFESQQWVMIRDGDYPTFDLHKDGITVWDTLNIDDGSEDIYALDKDNNEIWRHTRDRYISGFQWIDDDRFIFVYNKEICTEEENSYQSFFSVGNNEGEISDEYSLPKTVLDIDTAIYMCDGKITRAGRISWNLYVTDDERIQVSGIIYGLFDYFGADGVSEFVGILDWKP